MAAPIERLKQRSEFLRVAATRQKWVTPGLILQAAARPAQAEQDAEFDSSPFRIGYTASRKVGNAVQRNRARRRLRAAVAEVMTSRASEGWDYVLIARRQTLGRPYGDLLADLEGALAGLTAKAGSQ
ncbi:MAG: ribonuclease P protein component [Alphaproteobacteria bacterium]